MSSVDPSTRRARPGQVEFPTALRVRLWDDYGAIGEGASLAHSIRAENGNEYIIKGPTLNPDLPYVAANELVAAQLASYLALPVLDFRIVEQGDTLFFGSSWMQRHSFHPAITEALFLRTANRDRNYDIVCFDYWIYNTDRHQHNLIVRKNSPTKESDELLVLNDHSHALIQAGTTPDELVSYVANVPAISLEFLRNSLTSRRDLGHAIELIQGVPTATIRAILATVPEAFLSTDDAEKVIEFLCQRRDTLKQLFADGTAAFPNLRGGSA